jgi:hypothetical protein
MFIVILSGVWVETIPDPIDDKGPYDLIRIKKPLTPEVPNPDFPPNTKSIGFPSGVLFKE